MPVLRNVHELIPTLHDPGHRLAAANSGVLDTAFGYHLAALSANGTPPDLGTAAGLVLAALAARADAIEAIRLQVSALCMGVTRQVDDLCEASVRWRRAPAAARTGSMVPLWPPNSRDLAVLEELCAGLEAHRQTVPRLSDDLAPLRREVGLLIHVWSTVEAARAPGSPALLSDPGDAMANACARLGAVLSAVRSTLEAELGHFAGAAEDNHVLRGQLITGQLCN
ncbi:hypothetical protein [Lentzea sp. E54]|uniref:hypothetical protein n=1 Tax=Lentzea xerophila TaxID=3435883 RepID=UPI003DA37F75